MLESPGLVEGLQVGGAVTEQVQKVRVYGSFRKLEAQALQGLCHGICFRGRAVTASSASPRLQWCLDIDRHRREGVLAMLSLWFGRVGVDMSSTRGFYKVCVCV